MSPEELLYASKLIHRKSRFLVRKLEFADVDRADIEHDLLIELLKRFPAFDPRRSKSTTFIARIVDHAVASLIRAKRAAKRDARRAVGLPDECNLAPHEMDAGRARHRRGIVARDSIRDSGLRHDLEAVLSGLPTEWRLLCALCIQLPVSRIARFVDRSRSSVRADLHKIRNHFEDAGLRDYL